MLTISQKTMKQFTKINHLALIHVMYEASGALVATDGTQLVKIYIDPLEAIAENVLLPLECFPSKAGYTTNIETDGNGNYIVSEFDKRNNLVGKRLVPICEIEANQFPDYNKVFPSSEPALPSAKIKLDTSRLLAFDALKAELVGKKTEGVELTFYSETSPIQIDLNGYFTGLLAPMRR